MKILVTGGLGYIGSHTVVELLENNHEVIIIDNLYNSQITALDNIEKITGIRPEFICGDCASKEVLEEIFTNHDIDAVIHFAGYKAVGESVKLPLKYYENNLSTTIALLEVMQKHNCYNFVFSSSATVYGDPEVVPITEDTKLGQTTNAYGSTKLICEQILTDAHRANEKLNVAILRYFNPIGAHESGLLGESPNDIPNNLMPYIVKVANGELDVLHVFGDDYPTHDGTGVRDYIHVVDLAKGHVAAINKLGNEHVGVRPYNLGTGTGYSVLDVLNTFNRVNNLNVNYQIDPRREGDIATCFANPTRAKEELGWEAKYDLEQMCKDSWKFVSKE